MHWGVPTEVRPRRLARDGDLAILEFAPTATRASWRYATNGMHRYGQPYSDGRTLIRTELFACTRERVRWVDELLTALAAYPFDHRTYLAEGDTIPAGGPVDRGHSPYVGVLLAPPGPVDSPTLGLVGGLPETVLVHQVVGLTADELAAAVEQGGEGSLGGTGEGGRTAPRSAAKGRRGGQESAAEGGGETSMSSDAAIF